MRYQLGKNDLGEPYIQCLTCKLKSYHPEDIRHRYCGFCKVFHDAFAPGVVTLDDDHPDS